MADIDVLPSRGIPAAALVDGNGIAIGGTSSVAQLAARGMRSICEVTPSGVAANGAASTVAQLASMGIRAFCPVSELGVATDASTADTLRQRGIRPMVPVSALGVALTGSATILTLAQRGLGYFCPLDETGTATALVDPTPLILRALTGSYLLTGEDMTPITEFVMQADNSGVTNKFVLTGQNADLQSPASPSTTWDADPSAHYSAVTLTTPLILHAGQGFGQASARTLSTVGRVLGSGGKACFEMKVSAFGSFNMFGISQADAMFATGGTLRTDVGTKAVCVAQNGFVILNGTNIFTPVATGSNDNAWVSFAIDFTAKKLWFAMDAMPNGVWNNGSLATQNPATGVGGVDISGLSAGTYFIATTTIGGEDTTLNAGASTFFRAMPAGFSNF